MSDNHRLPNSYLTHIRNVSLLPGEAVERVFSASEGLVPEPLGEGDLLVTTNRRILSFSQKQGYSEMSLVPIQELKGVTLRNGAGKDMSSLVQGGLMVAVGLVIYLALSYWLAGRIGGPSVPVINMDVGPLLVLLVVAGGLWTIVRYYFSQKDGEVTFQGTNWTFAFPYHGEKARGDIYQVVNGVFAGRQSDNGPSPSWEE